MAFVHHGGWNPNVDREIKLHTKLGRMNKGQLMKLGEKYGFNFQEETRKADMVVELAAEMMHQEDKNAEK